MQLSIVGRGPLILTNLVCDLNGTLAVDGLLIEGVATRIAQLSREFSIHLLTADTHGTLQQVRQDLQTACSATGQPVPQVQRIQTGEEKAQYVRRLGASHTVALGNGVNDEPMFALVALSIAILGQEGAAPRTLLAASLVTSSPVDALDLLLYPQRLVATLRR